jgi:ketosteroid isomerase-like protein
MSQENVELVRGIIDAHEHGDAEGVFSKYDPEIEWHLSTVFASVSEFDPVYYGHDGVRTFWRTWFSAWEKATFEYGEFIDAGDSVVTISVSTCVDAPAVLSWTGGPTARSGQSKTARLSASSLFTIVRKPSKPPGCRSDPEVALWTRSATKMGTNGH